MKQLPEVVADFDRIADALASSPDRRRLTAEERCVVRAIPSTARSALDVGCGDGRIARAVARRGLTVLAIDIAPRMIALARARSEPALDVDYRVGDIIGFDGPPPAFDVVYSVNMVHHLPLSLVLRRLAAFVAPGGTLIVQDVIARSGLRHLPVNVVAALWSRLQRLGGGSRTTGRVQRLYEQHGRGEVYLRSDAVRSALEPFLPGVAIRVHLGWRYTAVWSRPAGI